METELTFCKNPMPLSSFEAVTSYFSSYVIVPGCPAAKELGRIDRLFSCLAPDPVTGRHPSLWIEAPVGASGSGNVWFEVACPEAAEDRRLIVSDRKSATLLIRIEEGGTFAPDPETSERLSRFLRFLHAYLARIVGKIKADPDSYNTYIRAHFPFGSRYGTICRKDLYEVCPEWRIPVTEHQAELLGIVSDQDGYWGAGLGDENDLPACEGMEPSEIPLVRFRTPKGRWFVRIVLEEERYIVPTLALAEQFERRGIPFLLSRVQEIIDVLSEKGRLKVVPGFPCSYFDTPEICLPEPDDEVSAREREELIGKIDWEPFPLVRILK